MYILSGLFKMYICPPLPNQGDIEMLSVRLRQLLPSSILLYFLEQK